VTGQLPTDFRLSVNAHFGAGHKRAEPSVPPVFVLSFLLMKKGIDYTGIVVCNFRHNGKGEYVLGFRSDKSRDEHFTWEPTGSGGLKFGETIEDAVRREVMEELASEVKQIEFLGIHEALRDIDGQVTHWLYILNKVLVDDTMVKITEPEKCLKLEWFTIGNFPSPLMSQFPPLLERFKDKF